jgi:hypothetical protein
MRLLILLPCVLSGLVSCLGANRALTQPHTYTCSSVVLRYLARSPVNVLDTQSCCCFTAGMTKRNRAVDVNKSQIDSWLWQARHAIRKGRLERAYEAMLSALWLMGIEK